MRERIRRSTVSASYILAAAFAACLFSPTTASAQQEASSAFVIVQRTATTGSESIQAEYAKLAREILPKYGARYLARSQRNVLLEGSEPAPCCIAILQFPSMDSIRRWYDSPENQSAAKVRQSGAKFEIIAVEGLPPAQ
jgi:uncharacterized protein (DUF1330 family)